MLSTMTKFTLRRSIGDRAEGKIADYLAAGQVIVGELIGIKFDQYPNVARWAETMKSLPTWNTVHAPFYEFKKALSGMSFVTLD